MVLGTYRLQPTNLVATTRVKTTHEAMAVYGGIIAHILINIQR
jgi:hypothetical protein